jgi:transketolase
MRSLKETKLKLLEMHYKVKAGHIGGNLSCIEIMRAVVETRTVQEGVVISNAHAAGAWYATLWSMGATIDLDTFHQDKTMLSGHLENGGSLGHGLSLAAGLALAKKLKGEEGYVYCLTSDGEWDEGSTWEAFHFILENPLRVKIIVDWNGWQGFKKTTKDLATMFASYWGLRTYTCEGHHLPSLRHSLKYYDVTLASTRKGHGVSFLENTLASHYEPLTEEQYIQACEEIRCAKD